MAGLDWTNGQRLSRFSADAEAFDDVKSSPQQLSDVVVELDGKVGCPGGSRTELLFFPPLSTGR